MKARNEVNCARVFLVTSCTTTERQKNDGENLENGAKAKRIKFDEVAQSEKEATAAKTNLGRAKYKSSQVSRVAYTDHLFFNQFSFSFSECMLITMH